jgi:phosphatidylinositol-3-phosphatase
MILHQKRILVLLIIVILTGKVQSQSLPVPDHIVIAILENHSFSQIIGSEEAPFINSLSADSCSALFTHYFGIEHPSQPNYLDLYSGSNQGVINNDIPAGIPFTTANLGGQLIDSGKTFAIYSEDLPYAGFNGASFDAYVRKHNPAANWMGTDTNQIPETCNQPFSAFPANDFSLLPAVCFVVPNQNNNMHDGTIAAGDDWIYNNLNGYIEWAKSHNSLFILTYDENDGQYGSNIVTIFTGSMVKSGEYADCVNHFSVLRTIEDMYGLPYAGNASSAIPITNCWKDANLIFSPPKDKIAFQVYPNPAENDFFIQFDEALVGSRVTIEIQNIFGVTVRQVSAGSSEVIQCKLDDPGVYFAILSDNNKRHSAKFIMR